MRWGNFSSRNRSYDQFWLDSSSRARVRIEIADIGIYLTRGRRTVDERRSEGLEALKMISVHMGEEASQRWWTIIAFPKVVDLMVMMLILAHVALGS